MFTSHRNSKNAQSARISNTMTSKRSEITEKRMDKSRIFAFQARNGSFHVVLRHKLNKTMAKSLRENGNMAISAQNGGNFPFSEKDKKLGNNTISKKGCLVYDSGDVLPQIKPLSDLRNLKSKTLHAAQLIDFYLYIGTLHINEDNVLSILDIASRLRLVAVQEACVYLLSKSHLKVQNFNELNRLTLNHFKPNLKKKVVQLINRYFSKCLVKNDFVSLACSLTRSRVDRDSLKFLLRRYCHGNKTKNTIKIMIGLLKNEAKMWNKLCFKEYIQSIHDLNGNNAVNETRKGVITTTNTQPLDLDTKNNMAIHGNSSVQNILDNMTIKLGGIANSKASKATKSFQHVTQQPENNMAPVTHKSALKTLGQLSTNDEGRDNGTVIVSEKISNAKDFTMFRRKSLNDAKNTQHKTPQPADNMALQQMALEDSPVDKISRYFLPKNNQNQFIIISGGICNSKKPEPLSSVFLYCPGNGSWEQLPDMKHERFNHSLVAMGDVILAIGGSTISDGPIGGTNGISINDVINKPSRQTQTNSIEVLSSGDCHWKYSFPMILSREEHCSVALQNHVYTIGGHDGVSQLCSVEKFDSKCNHWSLEKPMTRLNTGACAVTDGRYIYVIGGYNGITWLNSIECYDTLTKSWSRGNYPVMTQRRGYAGAELKDHNIYVFGGTDGRTSLSSCEIFDTKERVWSPGPALNQERLNAAHCIIQGKIVTMGGEGRGKFLDTVEELDIEQWKWKNINCKLPVKVAGHRACAVGN